MPSIEDLTAIMSKGERNRPGFCQSINHDVKDGNHILTGRKKQAVLEFAMVWSLFLKLHLLVPSNHNNNTLNH